MKKLLGVLMFLMVTVGVLAGTLGVITGGTQVATYAIDVQGDFIKSPSGNRVEINESGQMHVVMRGAVDSNNTTVVPLASGAQFVGSPTDILDYGIVFVAAYSDVPGMLSMQQSCDGVNWDITDDYNISATHGKTFSIQPACRYFRVVYTNGGTPQTVFRLSTTLKKMNSKPSSHRISDTIVDDDDAELVKAVLSGVRDSGVFTNARFDDSDRLKVVSQEYTYAISEGRVPNHFPQFKFGTRTTVAQNTQSSIWEGTSALYVYATAAEQLSIVSSSVNDTASGTGLRTLFISGLDASFAEINETVTLDGTTPVTSTKSYIRVNRAYGVTCGTGYTNAGNINITGAGGAQRIYIPAGDGQTLMALWTVPASSTAFITQISASTNSNKGARVSVYTRTNDGGILYPWRIRYRSYLFSGDDIVRFNIPLVIPEKTDIEIRVTTPAGAGDTSMGATFELWYE